MNVLIGVTFCIFDLFCVDSMASRIEISITVFLVVTYNIKYYYKDEIIIKNVECFEYS